MIVANRKSVPELVAMIQAHDRVLLLGCGTCVTVCLSGGEHEVGVMGSALRMALRLRGRAEVVVDECTIERQCEDAFIDLVAPRIADCDAVCSFGCGAGVQMLAEAGLEPERLSMVHVASRDGAGFARIVGEATARAEALGPSPLRPDASMGEAP